MESMGQNPYKVAVAANPDSLEPLEEPPATQDMIKEAEEIEQHDKEVAMSNYGSAYDPNKEIDLTGCIQSNNGAYIDEDIEQNCARQKMMENLKKKKRNYAELNQKEKEQEWVENLEFLKNTQEEQEKLIAEQEKWLKPQEKQTVEVESDEDYHKEYKEMQETMNDKEEEPQPKKAKKNNLQYFIK